jgi:hypothetical protein
MTHNLLKTEQYLLVVDDNIEDAKYWVYICPQKGIALGDDGSAVVKNVLGPSWFNRLHDKANYKKVIAHLPLDDAPDLKGVDLLPPLPTKNDMIEEMLDSLFGEVNGSNIHIREAFKMGYNKAKENYKYTEEDMKKAIAFGVSVRDQGLHLDQFIYDKFFQQLKLPELPVAFECVSRQPYYKVWAGNYIY